MLYAFELAAPKIDSKIIFDYAKNTSLAVCKRLGWVFDELDMFPEIQEKLEAIPMRSSQRLDASGERRGKISKRWNVQENIYYEAKTKTPESINSDRDIELHRLFLHVQVR